MKWIIGFIILAGALVAYLSLTYESGPVPLSPEAHEPEADASVQPELGDHPPAHLLRFQDERWNYAVDYPTDWQLADHSSSSEMIRADIHRDNTVGIQIRVVRRGSSSFESFVETYIGRFIEDMTSHWQGTLSEHSKNFDRIGRHEGCEVRMVLLRGDGQRWLLKQYLWPVPNDADAVVVFQCGSSQTDQILNEQYLDTIARSFRFTGDH